MSTTQASQQRHPDDSGERYVRFRATARNRLGNLPGVFGLVNGLARAGKLTEEQERFRRVDNAWYHANCTDPSTVDPGVYDAVLHPGEAAWFRTSATQLIERVDGYLAILDAHGVGWERVRSDGPGEIVYRDDQQVIAVPGRTTLRMGIALLGTSVPRFR